MRTTIYFFLFIFIISNAIAAEINLEEEGWPRDLKFKKGVISIYQPQIETYEKNKIEARAAIAIKINDKAPVFGAMWFTSRAVTDLDEHLVVFDDVNIETLKFPEGDAEKVENLRTDMTAQLDGISMTISLERFMASIEHLNEDGNGADEFNNDPPTIYFETEPAVLVYIDGDPILKEVESSSIKYVLNTPYFLVLNPSDNKYYLKGGQWWYSSSKIENGWKSISIPPKDILDLSEQAFEGDETDLDSLTVDLDNPPKLIVSTIPAELIQTDGEPKFEPVPETNLLFMTNCESDVIMDINSQKYFILLSGRWFSSEKMDSGQWKYITTNELPDEFQKIPDTSDLANVRYSVPGTQEAKDAMLENSIPQTAEIDRKTATVTVEYDGDPKFKKIETTSISYAENSDKTVLLISNEYYVVDDAVWFVAPSANGPWEVCVDVPEEVQNIPPESPVYNVKYVYVYDHTPEVVYVGYTPGYYGSYVYHGTVIYGTGFWYHPWYWHAFYPRPVTWGYGVHYNPWTGWGFSFGVSYGWVAFGWHPYTRGWWGPVGFRVGYRHGFHRGFRHGYRSGFRAGYAAGRRAGYVAGRRSGSRQAMRSNVYRNRANGVRNTGTRPANRPNYSGNRPTTRPTNPSTGTRPSNPSTGTRPSTGQPRTRENNVYSDRSGNIYKRDNSGSWQQRNNGQWNSPSTRPSQGGSNNLNRDYSNRNRGNQRANSYSNRSRQSAPRSAPSRGGGGRRR